MGISANNECTLVYKIVTWILMVSFLLQHNIVIFILSDFLYQFVAACYKGFNSATFKKLPLSKIN